MSSSVQSNFKLLYIYFFKLGIQILFNTILCNVLNNKGTFKETETVDGVVS